MGRARLSVEARVRRAYYDYLLARAQLELIEDRGRSWREIADIVRERYAVGLGVQQDMLRAQVEVLRLDEARAEQDAQVTTRRAEINRAARTAPGEPRSRRPRVWSSVLRPPICRRSFRRSATGAPSSRALQPGHRGGSLSRVIWRRRTFCRTSSRAAARCTAAVSTRCGRSASQSRSRFLSVPGSARFSHPRRPTSARRRLALLRHARSWNSGLASASQNLEAVLRIARLYDEGVLPVDQLSLESAIVSYRNGKVPFVTVLEALNTLYADRSLLLNRLAEAEKVARLDRRGGSAGRPGMPAASTGAAPAAASTSSFLHEVMNMKFLSRSTLPWILASLFAAAFVTLALYRQGSTKPAGAAAASPAAPRLTPPEKKVLYWTDPMMPGYKSDKPGKSPFMDMELVPVYEDGSSGEPAASVEGYSAIKLPQRRQQAIGVQLGKAETRDLTKTIRTVGRVTFDETLNHQIHAKFEGYVEKLYVDFTGQAVRRGQPLLSIYSPELLATQQEYLLAFRARQQFKGSSNAEVARGGVDLYDSARQRLLLWDISPRQIQELEQTGKPQKALTLYSAGRRFRPVQERGAGGPRHAGRHALRDRRSPPRLGPRGHLRIGSPVRQPRPDRPDDALLPAGPNLDRQGHLHRPGAGRENPDGEGPARVREHRRSPETGDVRGRRARAAARTRPDRARRRGPFDRHPRARLRREGRTGGSSRARF